MDAEFAVLCIIDQLFYVGMDLDSSFTGSGGH